MHVMKSMELDDVEIGEVAASAPIPLSHHPKYPYGLQICLTTDELKKLGLDPAECCVGGMLHGAFMARITSTSQNECVVDGKTETRNRVELQIESMAIEGEDAENEEAGIADRLYTRKKKGAAA